MSRVGIVKEYYINEHKRSDALTPSAQLVDCKINELPDGKSKALVKIEDGFYLSLIQQTEVFLRSCSLLHQQNKDQDIRSLMLTIWFKDNANISDYFRQVRKYINQHLINKGVNDPNPVLYYHGQGEKHTRISPIHYHFSVVFDCNQIRDNYLRKLLMKPKSYCRVIDGEHKLPYISTKDRPCKTNGDGGGGSNKIAVHTLKKGLANAIQHYAYFCKVNQKVFREKNKITGKYHVIPLVTKRPTSNFPEVKKKLTALGLLIPIPTKQPNHINIFKEDELANLRDAEIEIKAKTKVVMPTQQQEECPF